jgi:cyclic pyranopterin phosphate synthase
MKPKRGTVETLKLKITSGCNLACVYCVAEDHQRKGAKKKGIRHTELLRVVKVLVDQGVRNIDFIGCEPLVKKWSCAFLDELMKIPELKRVSILTNGVILKDLSAELIQMGIRTIGVHIDSLNFEKYMTITRGDHLYRVFAGLQEAEKLGMQKIRIYVLVLNGFNDKEIIDFGLLTKEHPYEIIFLEYLPYDAKETRPSRENLRVPLERMKQEINDFQKLYPVEQSDDEGEVYRFDDGKGTMRFVSPFRNHHCGACKRITVTTEGMIGSCFLSDKLIDLRPVLSLKEGQEYNGILQCLDQALRNRPRKPPKQEKPFKLCSQLAFLDE